MSTQIPIIIPAYKPNEELIILLKELYKSHFNNVIVVNDGSGDEYNAIFEQAQKYCRCILTHLTNQGKGMALKTGFMYVLREISEAVGCVTADSDGQHSVDSIKAVAIALNKNPQNLILGSRYFNKSNVPIKSYLGNVLTQKIFKYLEGKNIQDTQTGLRGIPLNFMKECILLPGKRFEFEMQMLLAAIEKIKIIQISIKTIYNSRCNHSTHFHTFRDSLSIYKVLGKRFVLYTFSSISSFFVDICLFMLFLKIFSKVDENNMIICATVCSRILSICYNYLCNYIFVFKSQSKIIKSLILYFILAIMQLVLSFSLVISIKHCMETKHILSIKILVDVLLFIISYFVQQRYIFKIKNKQ